MFPGEERSSIRLALLPSYSTVLGRDKPREKSHQTPLTHSPCRSHMLKYTYKEGVDEPAECAQCCAELVARELTVLVVAGEPGQAGDEAVLAVMDPVAEAGDMLLGVGKFAWVSPQRLHAHAGDALAQF